MNAVCVLTNNAPNISGFIEFIEKGKSIIVNVKVSGLSPGYHGIHIHQTGDLRKGCDSLCSHFNPFNAVHGAPNNSRTSRHVGDLGNIYADQYGNVNQSFEDNLIKLKGKCNIIGRSVVIHEKDDDLGLGGLSENGDIINEEKFSESLKTGNAGKRIACGVIGWVS